MKELVAYLTENIKLVLLLAAIFVVLAIGWTFANAFPVDVDPSEPLGAATEDPYIGVGELMDIAISKSLTFSNLQAEWGWLGEGCESLSPALNISLDIINPTNETQALLLLLISPGTDGGIPAVHELGHTLVLPGEQLHYDDWSGTQNANFSTPGDGSTPSPGALANASLLIMGLPEIAGNFAETADGETGDAAVYGYGGATGDYALNLSFDIKPVIGDLSALLPDPPAELNSAFVRSFSFSSSSDGIIFGPRNGQSLVDGSVVFLPHIEYPNLEFMIPEVEDEVLLKEHFSYAVFVFNGARPAGWNGITQFEVTDFEFIDQALVGMALILPHIEQDPMLVEPLVCTPTATWTPGQLQTTGTATPGSWQPDASPTPRPTEGLPGRTPKPTQRNTPIPTQSR